MRDAGRIAPFLRELEEIWTKNPDLRFAQLIVNLMQHYGSDMYYTEDESFLNKLKEFYRK